MKKIKNSQPQTKFTGSYIKKDLLVIIISYRLKIKGWGILIQAGVPTKVHQNLYLLKEMIKRDDQTV